MVGVSSPRRPEPLLPGPLSDSPITCVPSRFGETTIVQSRRCLVRVRPRQRETEVACRGWPRYLWRYSSHPRLSERRSPFVSCPSLFQTRRSVPFRTSSFFLHSSPPLSCGALPRRLSPSETETFSNFFPVSFLISFKISGPYRDFFHV